MRTKHTGRAVRSELTQNGRCSDMVQSHTSWTWRLEPDSVAAQDPGSFSNQSDAESWLGEAWRQLAEAGVTGVVLVNDGKDVYGPMPLSE
ncbi:MAG: hypothetical protein QOE89_827 [Pseudonocardiales bacterium]|nr:hypothetical protein [Pseudonocardiales bacterium]